ncbi:MAG TPA: CHAD domain-containing protein, partial [Hydrogenophaga sp.]
LSSPPAGAALLHQAHALFALTHTTGAPTAPQAGHKKSGKAHKATPGSWGANWAQKRMATVRRQLERTLKASTQRQASDELIHQSRLKAKRARYAAEMLRDVLPADSGIKLARKATAIQTRVGEDRDMQQAIALLQAMGADARLIGFLQGVRAGRAASAPAVRTPRKPS